MNKYAKYLKELKNFEMYEDEKGFITFGLMGDGLYVEDVYVLPEFRQQHVGSDYVRLIEEKAKEIGLKCVYTSLVPSLKNSHERLIIITSYGFKLCKADNDFIWFIKEI
jgi:GNAT superfamily N-acetyltransferase